MHYRRPESIASKNHGPCHLTSDTCVLARGCLADLQGDGETPYLAKQFGKPCPQPKYTSLPVAETSGSNEPQASPYDEDCLKLNIWMPAGKAPEGGFPVYLWMHGYVPRPPVKVKWRLIAGITAAGSRSVSRVRIPRWTQSKYVLFYQAQADTQLISSGGLNCIL